MPLQIGEIMSNNKIMQVPYFYWRTNEKKADEKMTFFHDGICHVCDIGWCFWKNASWDTIQSSSATSWSFLPPSAPTATPQSLRYLLSCGTVQVLSRSLVCLVSAIFVFVLHPGRPIMLCVSRWLLHRGKSPLTAVRTGYPLTSITWSYHGLRYLPIEVDYFFEVIYWQVTSFQIIAVSSSFFEIKIKINLIIIL